MTSTLICQDGNDPYLNNVNAVEIQPRTNVTHEGMDYTKRTYALNLPAMERAIKIIQAIALTIFTLFIALAFEYVRNMWGEGIRGDNHVEVLMPANGYFFHGIQGIRDVENRIGSMVGLKNLLALGETSKQNHGFVKQLLIDQLNSGAAGPSSLGFSTIKQLTDFFGDSCQEITKLDLINFPLNDSDIKSIADSFTKLNYLRLLRALLSNNASEHFAKMTSLKSLNIENCEGVTDFSFLQHCLLLENLNLKGCKHIRNLDFLQYCPNITSLNLMGCQHINDIEPIQKCQKLISLNLSECIAIQDLNFLQNCQHLSELILSHMMKEDISFLQHIPNLSDLKLFNCKEIKDFSVIKNCKNLQHLDLSQCTMKDCSFLENSLSIISLDLNRCEKIENFSFLQLMPNLIGLSIKRCEQIESFDFTQNFNQLTSLNLTGCRELNNIRFLKWMPNLTELNLSFCQEVDDFSPLLDCKELKRLNIGMCTQIDEDLLKQLNFQEMHMAGLI